MDDFERFRLLVWIGFLLWVICTLFVTTAMIWAASKGRGPFTVGNALLMVANMFEASVYVYIIEHPHTSISRFGPDLVLWSVIFRAVVFLSLGITWIVGMWRNRRAVS